MKNIYILLAAAYLSFVALGFFDGAFSVAWPVLRYDMRLELEQAGVLIIVNSIFWTLSGSQIGRLLRYTSSEKLTLFGITALMLALLGFSLAGSFGALMFVAGLAGFGSGLIDSGLNSYMARNFSSRHMNWLHCCWSMGAAISPIIMAQMIMSASWRVGYVSLAAIQGVIAVFVLISMLCGAWIIREGRTHNSSSLDTTNARFLTQPHFQYMHMAIFFLFMGVDYSIGFWTTSVLLESRGLDIEHAGMYPAVYFASIMLGRIVSGYLAKYFRNITMIRVGFMLAITGIMILMHSNSLFGMSLIGFGLAPIYPCLMHETSRRFAPDVLAKLVGYQVASASLGVAILGPATGLILTHISLEALFPIGIFFAVSVFTINEAIEAMSKKEGAAA